MIERVQLALSWSRTHQLTVTVVLFVVASLISIYSTEIKQFLHHWPRTRVGVLYLRRNRAINDLELLNRLHNNAYHLLLYFIWKIAGTTAMAVFVCSPFVIFELIFSHRLNTSYVRGVVAGYLLGAVFEVRTIVLKLHNYDDAVKKLEKKIQAYESLPKR